MLGDTVMLLGEEQKRGARIDTLDSPSHVLVSFYLNIDVERINVQASSVPISTRRHNTASPYGLEC